MARRPAVRIMEAVRRRRFSVSAGIRATMIRAIANVVPSRAIDPRQLGWLADRRAATRSNFPANFEYVDLRGAEPELVDRLLQEERDGYAYLEANGFSDPAVDEIDQRQALASALPMLDFGVAAAVAAVSALGCVPVTSCRGPTLGRRPHSQPAPMVVFYARRRQIQPLIDAVVSADCHVVNNGAKIEVYADDVRKLHRFAVALRRRLTPTIGDEPLRDALDSDRP